MIAADRHVVYYTWKLPLLPHQLTSQKHCWVALIRPVWYRVCGGLCAIWRLCIRTLQHVSSEARLVMIYYSTRRVGTRNRVSVSSSRVHRMLFSAVKVSYTFKNHSRSQLAIMKKNIWKQKGRNRLSSQYLQVYTRFCANYASTLKASMLFSNVTLLSFLE